MSLKSQWWRPTLVAALVLVGCQANPTPLQTGEKAEPDQPEGFKVQSFYGSECGPLADLIDTKDIARTVYYPNCTTTIKPGDIAWGKLDCYGLKLALFDPETKQWVYSLDLGPGVHYVRVAYLYEGYPINCGETAKVTVNSAIVCNVNDPTELWPPNHDYSQVFNINDLAKANSCNGAVGFEIVKVCSDEPEELHPKLDNTNDGWNGDGRTFEDIVLLSNTTFKVRMERAGSADGRVYSVKFKAKYVNGATTDYSYHTCYITVPHDQSGRPAIDSTNLGKGYCVKNNGMFPNSTPYTGADYAD